VFGRYIKISTGVFICGHIDLYKVKLRQVKTTLRAQSHNEHGERNVETLSTNMYQCGDVRECVLLDRAFNTKNKMYVYQS